MELTTDNWIVVGLAVLCTALFYYASKIKIDMNKEAKMEEELK